jgi:hypothetical protein
MIENHESNHLKGSIIQSEHRLPETKAQILVHPKDPTIIYKFEGTYLGAVNKETDCGQPSLQFRISIVDTKDKTKQFVKQKYIDLAKENEHEGWKLRSYACTLTYDRDFSAITFMVGHKIYIVVDPETLEIKMKTKEYKVLYITHTVSKNFGMGWT